MRYFHFAPFAVIALGVLISACSPTFGGGPSPQRDVIVVPQR